MFGLSPIVRQAYFGSGDGRTGLTASTVHHVILADVRSTPAKSRLLSSSIGRTSTAPVCCWGYGVPAAPCFAPCGGARNNIACSIRDRCRPICRLICSFRDGPISRMKAAQMSIRDLFPKGPNDIPNWMAIRDADIQRRKDYEARL